jgi:hypothetical protein
MLADRKMTRKKMKMKKKKKEKKKKKKKNVTMAYKNDKVT